MFQCINVADVLIAERNNKIESYLYFEEDFQQSPGNSENFSWLTHQPVDSYIKMRFCLNKKESVIMLAGNSMRKLLRHGHHLCNENMCGTLIHGVNPSETDFLRITGQKPVINQEL